MTRSQARLLRCALGCSALLLALLSALTPLAGSISAADPPYIVNSTLDQPDSNTNDGVCSATPSGKCTLRAAVQQGQAANRAVSVPAGTYTLSLGQLVVAANRNLVLSGAGSGKTILDGGNDSRIFDIHQLAFAYIAKVSIENGDAGNSEVFPGHYHGGGIHNHGMLTLVDSTLRFNSSYTGWNGGGMTNAGTGNATLVNVTIRTNYGVDGAGIENLGALNITNATVAWNSASSAGAGGGIFNSNGGQPLAIKNTILTNNYSGGNLKNCSGLPASAANGNLASDASCGFPAGDSNINVLLGGFDFDDHIYPLLPGSPALDGGLNAGCPSQDQRGADRPQDGNANGVATCDVGAYEFVPPDLAITYMADSPDPVQAGDSLIYTIDVLNPGPTALSNVKLIDNLPAGVTYASFSETRGGSCAHVSGVVTCDLATLDGNRVWTIRLYTNVLPAAAGVLDNAASASASGSDPNPANNTATEATTIGSPPDVRFSAASTNVGEGTGAATITVELSAAADQQVTIHYATSNGSASAPSDYAATSGDLTFNIGQTSKTFSVPIVNDSLEEAGETIALALSEPSGASLAAPSSATLTILDDDAAESPSWLIYLPQVQR